MQLPIFEEDNELRSCHERTKDLIKGILEDGVLDVNEVMAKMMEEVAHERASRGNIL